MFECSAPRIFTLPPGVDFPVNLVAGLRERMAEQPAEAMARVTVYINTSRMRRRIEDLFHAEGHGFLPKLLLLTDLSNDPRLALPPTIPPLRRRLELSTLVSALLDAQPDLAPRSALYDLSDSLATLMDEMQGEGVLPDTVAGLDVSGHSLHWARTKTFLQIIAPIYAQSGDKESRQRLAVVRQSKLWGVHPPADPIIIAGSTGSRGTTLLFMKTVALLPQGAVILPGFDAETPPTVWDAMSDALTAEDHPQYRFRRLMDLMGIYPADLRAWRDIDPPDLARNKLVSLSLRPAPVTDQWLVEGPSLPNLVDATAGLSLIEAPTPRQEALSIALILRNAAEEGVRAALISPDRNLTRQVTAALDRWGILPDDSAGKPLAHSAPGRFLRHTASLFGEKLSSDRLLTVLKHPLAGSGGERGTHLRFTRDLELELRKHGPAFPDADDLVAWAKSRKDPEAVPWADFFGSTLQGLQSVSRRPLKVCVDDHRRLAEALARGPGREGAGRLWEGEAGAEALRILEGLEAEADFGGQFSAPEYRDLFEALVAQCEVRDAVQSHPHIMIWGTLEARVQGADLVILGGLNDAVWPKLPDPDPWLNRQMRKSAGLLLPERQIGLSAHDYQQAIAAPKVILTRSCRDAEAETVPSRWLNRLLNLMQGLPQRNGDAALARMRSEGARWLKMAYELERPTQEMRANPRLAAASRPAPQPPINARPERLSLTRIEGLIRDPYAIYARHVLRLLPLDKLHPTPNARDRGVAIHEILAQFVHERPFSEDRNAARARLLQIARTILTRATPFPAARALWLAKLDRAAAHFLTQDARHGGIALAVETVGAIKVGDLPFTLFGTPDRIDELPDGTLHLIDYKTGAPPTEAQQRSYAKQLLLAAALAERGGFADLGPTDVSRISYVGLGSGEKVVETAITSGLLAEEWAKLVELISHYFDRNVGYVARRAVFETRFPGDYDHLARFGEWQMSDRAVPERVGQVDASDAG